MGVTWQFVFWMTSHLTVSCFSSAGLSCLELLYTHPSSYLPDSCTPHKDMNHQSKFVATYVLWPSLKLQHCKSQPLSMLQYDSHSAFGRTKIFAGIPLPTLTYKLKTRLQHFQQLFFTKCAAFQAGKAHLIKRSEFDSRTIFYSDRFLE